MDAIRLIISSEKSALKILTQLLTICGSPQPQRTQGNNLAALGHRDNRDLQTSNRLFYNYKPQYVIVDMYNNDQQVHYQNWRQRNNIDCDVLILCDS